MSLTSGSRASKPVRAASANLGRTSLKLKRRNENSMREFDRLPAELRAWIASALLPWRPKSVHRTFSRAFERTQDATQALKELDRIQNRLIAKDARKIWGSDYPNALYDHAS